MAVLGGMGTAAAFVVAMVLDPVILAAGGGWMVVGMALYVLYRRQQGLPLTETVKVESLEPLGVEEVEYESVLLVLRGGPFSDETVATASALAAKRRRAIHVLSLRGGADEPAARRRAAARGERGAEQDRAGEADLRPAGHRRDRAGAAGPGGRRDHRAREGAQGRRRS